MTTDFNDLQLRAYDIAFRVMDVANLATSLTARVSRGDTNAAYVDIEVLGAKLAHIEGYRAELQNLMRKGWLAVFDQVDDRREQAEMDREYEAHEAALDHARQWDGERVRRAYAAYSERQEHGRTVKKEKQE